VSTASWRIVKQLHGGSFPEVTAVTAAGRNGGWAFDGQASPTAWQRNGQTWSRVPFPSRSGEVVLAAGASSAGNVWAFTQNGGSSRALRWNGSNWSVAGTFSQEVGGTAVLGPADVWAFGQPFIPGNVWAFDGTAVAHWNGHTWTKLAQGNYGFGTQPLQQIASDGHGGLWLPMPGVGGQKSYLLHYAGGHLTAVALPAAASRISVLAVAQIPGTTNVLAGGFTHSPGDPGRDDVAVILEYAR
jgi:hypothetical protein